MATKAKPKAKAPKKAAGRASRGHKSLNLKAKSPKPASSNGSRNVSKPSANTSARRTIKPVRVESRRTAAAPSTSASRANGAERARSKHFSNAIQAYEAGLKFMHAEDFDKAIRCFQDLIADYPEEPEIQQRAKVVVHVCEKKTQERARTVLRSSDDHYNVGIADLNNRQINSAIDHLQHALKLMPKGDHILYALATANALQGSREQALAYLKQSIQYRGENRFLAARDSDFESLQEDPDFRQLVASEK